MATVSTVLTQLRYDLSSISEIIWVDAELVEYLNRAIRILNAELVAINSDLVLSSDSLALAEAARYVAEPTNCFSLRSLWISDDEIEIVDVDELYEDRQYIGTDTGQPTKAAHSSAQILFDYTADAAYTITAYFNLLVSDVTTSSNMPYSDRFDDQLKTAVIMFAKHRAGMLTNPDAEIAAMFRTLALRKQYSRMGKPKHIGFGI